MLRTPLRVSVIGIDGAGKSSTTLRAIDLLSSHGVVCKPGRDPFVQRGSARTHCLPKLSEAFERAFRTVDTGRHRVLIGLSRLMFIGYQGWLEPHLIDRFGPSYVLSTRCMILDPAIYSSIYWPPFRRMSLERRIRFFRAFSRLPFRDLYIFLRTPAEIAMDRIFKRIARTPGYDREPREYWLHLHERESILARLGESFGHALRAARRLYPIEAFEIDTARHTEVEVAQLIADKVRDRAAARSMPRLVQCA